MVNYCFEYQIYLYKQWIRGYTKPVESYIGSGFGVTQNLMKVIQAVDSGDTQNLIKVIPETRRGY